MLVTLMLSLLCSRPAREPTQTLSTHELRSTDGSSVQWKAEVLLRLDELRAWAAEKGEDVQRVEELMHHPAFVRTLNNAIYLKPNGSRFETNEWGAHVEDVYREHNKQTLESRRGLAQKWSATLLGNVSSVDLLKLLHFTIDNTDAHLMYTSQFIHCLQVYRAVKNAAAHDPRFEQDAQYRDDMLVGALVHDLGKSLSLFGEADGNVDCMNRVTAYEVDPADQVAVAAYGAKASGLDAVQFQYNHDRFGHDKLLANVRLGLIQLPQRVLDICKFHSLRELASVRDAAEKVYVRHASPSTRTRLQAHLKGLVTLVDGDVVSPQEAAAFREHVASDGDVSRAAFVLHFAEYDLHSKNRTEEIPRDVDFGEVRELLRRYMGQGVHPLHNELTISW